jgi:hypothetical protein
MLATDERIDAQYLRATQAKRLLLEEQSTGAADVLTSAGLAMHFGGKVVTLGYELHRLFTKYGVTPDDVRRSRKPPEKGDVEKALADLRYGNTPVAKLIAWSAARDIDAVTACRALSYWLNKLCRKCGGNGGIEVAGTGRIGKVCPACNGVKLAPHPDGTEKVLAHIDYAVSVARGSLKKRLRSMR